MIQRLYLSKKNILLLLKTGEKIFLRYCHIKEKETQGWKRENTQNVNDRIKRSFEKSTVNTILFFYAKESSIKFYGSNA